MTFHPRLEKLVTKTAATVGGDALYELPDKGFCTGILNLGTANMTSDGQITSDKWRVMDYLDLQKVQANGSFDIVSITGRTAVALQWFNIQRGALGWHRDYAGGSNRNVTFIPFGKHPFDPKFSLKLDDYGVVEYISSNDAAAAQWEGISETVFAILFDELPPGTQRMGYLRAREWRKWTTVQNEWQYLKLPTEHKITRILIQSQAAVSTGKPDTDISNVTKEIQLKLKSGQITVYDQQFWELEHLNALDYGGEFLVSGLADKTAEYGIRTGMGRNIGTALGNMGDQEATNIPTVEDTQSEFLVPEARDGDNPITFLARGMCPEGHVVLRFDRKPNLEDVLDPAKDASILLNVHCRDSSSADNGTTRVILETLMTRPT